MVTLAIEFRDVDGDEAVRRLDELTGLYAEVYAEPPYGWGEQHAELFHRRFNDWSEQEGFALIEARVGGQLIGVGFGATLATGTQWWQNLLTPLPREATEERPGRTWALAELLVRAPRRRLHVAETIHDRLLAGRTEERVVLTVMPGAEAAQAAFAKWGWRPLTQKRIPLPGAPVFDILTRPLADGG